MADRTSLPGPPFRSCDVRASCGRGVSAPGRERRGEGAKTNFSRIRSGRELRGERTKTNLPRICRGRQCRRECTETNFAGINRGRERRGESAETDLSGVGSGRQGRSEGAKTNFSRIRSGRERRGESAETDLSGVGSGRQGRGKGAETDLAGVDDGGDVGSDGGQHVAEPFPSGIVTYTFRKGPGSTLDLGGCRGSSVERYTVDAMYCGRQFVKRRECFGIVRASLQWGTSILPGNACRLSPPRRSTMTGIAPCQTLPPGSSPEQAAVAALSQGAVIVVRVVRAPFQAKPRQAADCTKHPR